MFRIPGVRLPAEGQNGVRCEAIVTVAKFFREQLIAVEGADGN
jgi:hypothetical protein